MDLRWSAVPVGARRVSMLYGLLCVVDIVLSDAGARTADWITKPLLMPVLAVFTVLAARAFGGAERLPVAGIVLGGLGDTALIGHGTWFLVGMGCFAAGHVCYLLTARRRGALGRLDRRVVAGYGVVWAGLIAVLWSGLGGLRIPVVCYSLLLVGMGVAVSGLGRAAALGGALFVVSDGFIALGIAKVDVLPHEWILVMPTYVLAQLLLAFAWARVAAGPAGGARPAPAEPAPVPA